MIVEANNSNIRDKSLVDQSINYTMVLLTPADVIQIRQALSVLHSLCIFKELPHSQCVAADAIDALDKAQGRVV